MRRSIILLGILLLYACSPQVRSPTATETNAPNVTSTSTSITAPSSTSTPQPHRIAQDHGPELEDFASNRNPLTGREVQDLSLLKLPAVLVSISNMPVTARPQAGPGFAPWVFELFIGEGTTRFMNVFYGEYPRTVPNVTGGCKVRQEVIHPSGTWIGNRVWLDENENGVQDDWEMGVGGVCVRLLDGSSHEVQQETVTDSNGYYAFENSSDDVIVQFVKTNLYEFTKQDVGNDDQDSDAGSNGEIKIFQVNDTATFWDAGLVLVKKPIATSSPVVTGTPPNWFIPAEDYVGPIRSGRLTYNQIGAMFPNSCLIYASAAPDIGAQLNWCEIIFGVDAYTPNSALLTVKHMRELAEKSLNPKQPVNYSGNLFSETPPQNGQAAEKIVVFYHAYTQSGWHYDPISQTYLRFTDQADGTGKLIPATDRLTGRQMAFENVIIVFAMHNRIRHNQLEINFEPGQKEPAYLFRDGQVFKIYWSTQNRKWDKKNGLQRPMHFVDAQNNLVPLHPGRTWIHIVTPYSSVTDEGNDEWLVHFVQPDDPIDTPKP
ncbi:MAG: SdrD B-like domain-containing protein [Anaerolineales bacterium]